MASWPSLSFPSAKSADRIFLILNLVPLAISAGIRALFWYFEIPLLFMDGWAVKRKDVAWEHENSRIMDNQKDKRAKAVDALITEVIKRRAHAFPHAHGRPFPRHLAGLAKLIHHWKQVCFQKAGHQEPLHNDNHTSTQAIYCFDRINPQRCPFCTSWLQETTTKTPVHSF